ncbi:hypothetical protein CYJ10_06355 [Cupriavidus pauculus]|uniref:Uncharacterized protein n=1 Tax=Cupriavidus pauculus TaxID=82633 RepID=A0A2N5CGG7_9BURK|nr:hypothetical protein CYJ10_06355 [Cupriavidus pauculus]
MMATANRIAERIAARRADRIAARRMDAWQAESMARATTVTVAVVATGRATDTARCRTSAMP